MNFALRESIQGKCERLTETKRDSNREAGESLDQSLSFPLTFLIIAKLWLWPGRKESLCTRSSLASNPRLFSYIYLRIALVVLWFWNYANKALHHSWKSLLLCYLFLHFISTFFTATTTIFDLRNETAKPSSSSLSIFHIYFFLFFVLRHSFVFRFRSPFFITLSRGYFFLFIFHFYTRVERPFRLSESVREITRQMYRNVNPKSILWGFVEYCCEKSSTCIIKRRTFDFRSKEFDVKGVFGEFIERVKALIIIKYTLDLFYRFFKKVK